MSNLSPEDGAPRRHSRPQRWLAAASAAVMFSALAACGSGGGGDNDTLLDKVKSAGELEIAMASFAPQTFQKDDGTWTGYDVDILKGFAETLDAELKITPVPFDASIQAVGSRRADITVDIFYNEDRAKALSFSRPMLNYTDVVVVDGSDSGVEEATVEDLTGKKIGVTAGAVNAKECEETPDAECIKYTELADKLLALEQGRVDAIYTTITNFVKADEDPENDIKNLGPVPDEIAPPAEELRGYFGVTKGEYSESFLKELNAYLKKITCGGTLKEIIADYNLTEDFLVEGLCEAPNTYRGS